jgi:hypothetical protein
MATVAQLEARLEALKAQRDSAVARVSYDGRMIARRPDTIVGFGETRIHAETAIFEVRASEVAGPRPGDQLTVGAETFIVKGEPERRDPDRLVWTLDVRPV